jgi:general secretion pathway protein J
MNPRAHGFTLIEMLVALALVSLMSLAMYQSFRFSQRALMQVTLVDAAGRDVAVAQRFLRRVIEEAYPFELSLGASPDAAKRGLAGTTRQLEVSAPAVAAEGSKGLYRYHIAFESVPAGDLVATWGQDRNGVRAQSGERNISREVVLSGIQSLSFRYLELIEHPDGQIEPHWRDSWLDKSALPALVRVQIEFAPGDKRRWPDLIVAPRISTDANCVFDVVSQSCRIAS